MMENVSADGLAFWVTDLTEVSVSQVHVNAINSFQLISVKQSGTKCCFHERLIIGTKGWDDVGGSMSNSASNVVQIVHDKMKVTTINVGYVDRGT